MGSVHARALAGGDEQLVGVDGDTADVLRVASTIQHSTEHCSKIQYSIVQFSTVQYSTVPGCGRGSAAGSGPPRCTAPGQGHR